MGKKGLEFEQRLPADQLAALLEEIATGLRTGTLQISAGDKTVRLNPASIVKVELEAEGDDEKQEVSIEMSWRLPELRAVADRPGLAVTSSNPPEDMPSESI